MTLPDPDPSPEAPESLPEEFWVRLFAPPVAFLSAIALGHTQVGAMLERAYMSMFLHELGHAATALLLSFPAFPALWVTWIGDEREWAVTIVAVLAWGLLAWWGMRQARWGPLLLGTALAIAQVLLRLMTVSSARAAISFAGDAGAMVFGMGLVMSALTDQGTTERRRLLRWLKFLFGAGAFVDVATIWIRSLTDFNAIPLGRIEGLGLSDCSQLVQVHGWSTTELTLRYLAVGGCCLLVGLGAWGRAVLGAPGARGDEAS